MSVGKLTVLLYLRVFLLFLLIIRRFVNAGKIYVPTNPNNRHFILYLTIGYIKFSIFFCIVVRVLDVLLFLFSVVIYNVKLIHILM